jgi:hypothetical protein
MSNHGIYSVSIDKSHDTDPCNIRYLPS